MDSLLPLVGALAHAAFSPTCTPIVAAASVAGASGTTDAVSKLLTLADSSTAPVGCGGAVPLPPPLWLLLPTLTPAGSGWLRCRVSFVYLM